MNKEYLTRTTTSPSGSIMHSIVYDGETLYTSHATASTPQILEALNKAHQIGEDEGIASLNNQRAVDLGDPPPYEHPDGLHSIYPFGIHPLPSDKCQSAFDSIEDNLDKIKENRKSIAKTKKDLDSVYVAYYLILGGLIGMTATFLMLTP